MTGVGDSEWRRLSGRAFHAEGTACENELRRNVFKPERAILRIRISAEERRSVEEVHGEVEKGIVAWCL